MSGTLEQNERTPPEAQIVRAFASWSINKIKQRKPLCEGRYLIGDSAFADIRTTAKDAGSTICAVLTVGPRTLSLKCVAKKPTLFVEGRTLSVGEVVVIGDIIEVSVGRVGLTIAAAKISQTEHHAAPLEEKNSDEVRQLLWRKLLDQLDLAGISLTNVDSPEIKESARLKLRKLIADISFPEDFPWSKEEIEKQVYDEVMGLGPLEPLLNDEKVTEIMVNRRDQIFVERGGTLSLSKMNFSSDHALLNIIERIVSTIGRRIDQSSPIVDARLLDGSRVNAIIPPLALKGPSLTIRRFSKKPISVQNLIEWKSISAEMAAFLKLMVHGHKNLIISGGTGSGKTTLLNALSSFIPGKERIVTVEDAAELQLQQEHVISLETRPPNLEGKGAVTIRDLVKNTLRMRPDRIIVGECRGGEALDMLQAMNTGHDGSMTTAHANSPEDMLRRLETMVMMAGMELPLKAIREQIASALTIIVQQVRLKSGERLVTEVSWIKGLKDNGDYDVAPLFSRNKRKEIVVHQKAIVEFWQTEELDGNPNDWLCKPGLEGNAI